MTNILDNNTTPNFILTIILHFKRNKISSSDVEQTVHAGVVRVPEVTTQDQKGVPVEVIGEIVSKLHEIWQVEGKRHSDLDSAMVGPLQQCQELKPPSYGNNWANETNKQIFKCCYNQLNFFLHLLIIIWGIRCCYPCNLNNARCN